MEVNIIVPPGFTEPLFEKTENTGLRLTLKGEEFVAAIPCDEVVLHRGLTGSSSQTQPYQIFDSAKGEISVVVVAARACEPLVVEADTAQRVPPPEQIGGAVPRVDVDCVGVGVAALLQIIKKYWGGLVGKQINLTSVIRLREHFQVTSE